MFNPFNPYGQPMQAMPQFPPMQTQAVQPSGLNRVTGYDGARAFTIPPGSVAALFDDTRDVFYIKTTDSGGFLTLKAYRFTPLEEEPPTTAATASLSIEEIQTMIREEIENYGKQLVPANAKPDAKRRAELPESNSQIRGNDAGA